MSEEFRLAKMRFVSGVTLDFDYRREKLEALYKWIQNGEDKIAEALFEDLGKSGEESYMTETGVVLSEISFAIRHLKKWTGKHSVRTPLSLFPGKSYTLARPYGPVLVLSPWNYPFLLSVVPLVSAIAAGNTAVLRPSGKSPRTSKLLADMLSEVFPDREVQIAIGNHALAEQLLAEPFRLIFFTGSARVGRRVQELASRHLTPTVLELGGKCPCVVSDSADLELAARRIAFGKLVNAGQTCVAPDFVLASEKVRPRLEELLVSEFKRMAPEGASSETLPKIIDAEHFSRLERLVQNENVLCGGNALDGKFAPTVLSNVSFDSPVMQEEIFGPVLPVLSFKTEIEMAARLSTMPSPLALYVFTRKKKLLRFIQRELHFGGMTVNDTLMHVASPNLPFGGVGTSGMGRYHGEAGFKTFSHEESILERGSLFDFKFRYPPFSKEKSKLLRFFLR